MEKRVVPRTTYWRKRLSLTAVYLMTTMIETGRQSLAAPPAPPRLFPVLLRATVGANVQSQSWWQPPSVALLLPPF